jgi:hypothetical protein
MYRVVDLGGGFLSDTNITKTSEHTRRYLTLGFYVIRNITNPDFFMESLENNKRRN